MIVPKYQQSQTSKSFADFLKNLDLTKDDQTEDEFTVKQLMDITGLKKSSLYARLNLAMTINLTEGEIDEDSEEGEELFTPAVTKRRGNTGKMLYRISPLVLEEMRSE